MDIKRYILIFLWIWT